MLLTDLILSEKRKHPGPVIYRMASRRTAFSAQPHSRCLPWYNLYRRQIEFIATSLAQQQNLGDECDYKYFGSNTN